MNLEHKCIEARDVRPGDRIYNPHATHPVFSWICVVRVETRDGHTWIHTPVWSTEKHPREGVSVRREEKA